MQFWTCRLGRVGLSWITWEMCENRIGITFVVFEVKLKGPFVRQRVSLPSSPPVPSYFLHWFNYLIQSLKKRKKTWVFCSKHVSKNHLRLQELVAGSDENWVRHRGSVILENLESVVIDKKFHICDEIRVDNDRKHFLSAGGTVEDAVDDNQDGLLFGAIIGVITGAGQTSRILNQEVT